MGVKGSWQRPGQGYAEGWDAIFGKKEPTWSQEQLDQIKRGAAEILAKMGKPRMLGDDGKELKED